MRRKTEQEISDEVAAQALRHHGKSGPEPTHSSMVSPVDGFDNTDEEDAAQEDGDDWNEDRTS